jgi:hypothetical protein
VASKPRVETTENRTTQNGLFPIINTLGKKSSGKAWEDAYQKATDVLTKAGMVPNLPTPGSSGGGFTPAVPKPQTQPQTQVEPAPPPSEFKQHPELDKFDSRVYKRLSGRTLPQPGATQSREEAVERALAHRKAWADLLPGLDQNPYAQELGPYGRHLVSRYGTQPGLVETPSSRQENLGLAGEAAGYAGLAAMKKFPVIAPIASAGLAGAAQVAGANSDNAVAPNYKDLVPLATVANAELDYVQANKAYQSLSPSAPDAERRAAHGAVVAAHKTYQDAHKAYQDSIIGGTKDAPISAQHNANVSETNLTEKAGKNILSNTVGGTLSAMPGATKFLSLLGLAPEYIKGELGVNDKSEGEAIAETGANVAPALVAAMPKDPAQIAKLFAGKPAVNVAKILRGALSPKTLLSRAPLAIGANAAGESLGKTIKFHSGTEEDQAKELDQRAVNEAASLANRKSKIAPFLTRGLGYLATGDVLDTANYLVGANNPELMKGVAREAVAKRLENQKIQASASSMMSDPALERYSDYATVPDAARGYAHYTRQSEAAKKTPELRQQLDAANMLASKRIAARVGKLAPAERMALDSMTRRYGSEAMEKLWMTAPPGLIKQDLAEMARGLDPSLVDTQAGN